MPMPEPTVPLSLRLTPEQFRDLDEKARKSGVTRSDLVRQMLAQAVAAPREREQAA